MKLNKGKKKQRYRNKKKPNKQKRAKPTISLEEKLEIEETRIIEQEPRQIEEVEQEIKLNPAIDYSTPENEVKVKAIVKENNYVSPEMEHYDVNEEEEGERVVDYYDQLKTYWFKDPSKIGNDSLNKNLEGGDSSKNIFRKFLYSIKSYSSKAYNPPIKFIKNN